MNVFGVLVCLVVEGNDCILFLFVLDVVKVFWLLFVLEFEEVYDIIFMVNMLYIMLFEYVVYFFV